jgi:hypothetical protein
MLAARTWTVTVLNQYKLWLTNLPIDLFMLWQISSSALRQQGGLSHLRTRSLPCSQLFAPRSASLHACCSFLLSLESVFYLPSPASSQDLQVRPHPPFPAYLSALAPSTVPGPASPHPHLLRRLYQISLHVLPLSVPLRQDLRRALQIAPHVPCASSIRLRRMTG